MTLSTEGGETLDEEKGQEEEEVGTLFHGGGWRPPTSYHSGGGNAPSRLCLNDFRDLARLEAAGAYAHASSPAGDHRAHRDQIGKPAPLRELVRVADRMTDRGTLPADIAPLGHERSLDSSYRSVDRRQCITQGRR